ncbi:MAG TPA: hypothetical protein VGM06_05175 [Polyangiaceae bacterium]|jgi:hypothetical protein
MKRTIALGWTVVVSACPARAGADEAPAAPPSPASLADVDALRSELARQAEAIAELRRRASGVVAATEGTTLRVSGYVQVDWVVDNQASQDEVDFSTNLPLNQDRFTLRRGHVRLDAERGLVSAALEIDANTVSGPQVRPIDAELKVRWPAKAADGAPSIEASLGLMKIPFGFEVPELDQVRPFLERAAVLRALFPGEFDLGARLSLGYRSFEWAIALMNGNPIGDKVFPALAPVGTKELVGRLGTHVDVVQGVRLELGVSADTGLGFHEGTPTTKDQLVWRDENGDGLVQPSEIQVIPGSAATPSQQFRRFAIGADARVIARVPRLGDLAVRAEIVRGQNLDRGIEYADPVGAGHDLRELGWYIGFSQEITRWAMVGVRYDRYDPDEDASVGLAANLVPVDRTYTTLALMAMLRFESARLVVEYDKNDNALGRDATGAPTTLADDALTLRGQVRF